MSFFTSNLANDGGVVQLTIALCNGISHQLRVGSICALNQHDHHLLKANQGTHMRMVCVFNPPITGKEVHDETGAYALCD